MQNGGGEYIVKKGGGVASRNGLPEAEFLHEIQKKVWRVFLLVIHSHLYDFALRFSFLQTHATSYRVCKGRKIENLIENLTPFSMV